MDLALELVDVTHEYVRGDERVIALESVDLSVAHGEFVVLTGPSGSGKSTLLNVSAGIDRPTSGSVTINGRALDGLSDAEVTRIRRRELGFIFQFFQLMPSLTAIENVALPLMFDGVRHRSALQTARTQLASLGLIDRANHYPSELSGGEQQRVAVARAMVMKPSIVLADEPTGNLDSLSGKAVLEALARMAVDAGTAVVLATHDLNAVGYGSRRINLTDGRLVEH